MQVGKLVLPAIAFGMFLLGSQAVHAQVGTALENKECLGCHGAPGFSGPGPDGKERPLFVAADHFASSVHGVLQCTSCHTTITEVPHKSPPLTSEQWRQQIPKLCGNCHVAALKDYASSVHGRQVMDGRNLYAAICTDCHTTHEVAVPQLVASRISMTKACGACHSEAMESYTHTYHGQVLALGYANVATCSDCHRGHAILPASDAASSVASANVLGTCLPCHAGATPGFATFQAHATTDNFARYPINWIAAKALLALIVGVMGFFWIHSALWLYAELRDRRHGRPQTHVRADAVPRTQAQHVERWALWWRIGHFFFATSVILLILTGIPLLYPNTSWAPVLIRILGGPVIEGIVHRVAAIVMIIVFVAHLVYIAYYVALNWRTIRWFGPYSLLPTWQDAYDIVAMFKWFFGAGPRPVFDHWNYQLKVDYWAPFWGVAMLAITGALLWAKTLTAAYLPGWMFNISTLLHGDECVLAALYLFTIHFFVSHWRPDKFPIDVVIFTGSMPLDEFKHEFGVEYARLVKTGELKDYLVQAPSRPLTLGSKVVGFTLIAIGLVLLVMIVIGIAGDL